MFSNQKIAICDPLLMDSSSSGVSSSSVQPSLLSLSDGRNARSNQYYNEELRYNGMVYSPMTMNNTMAMVRTRTPSTQKLSKKLTQRGQQKTEESKVKVNEGHKNNEKLEDDQQQPEEGYFQLNNNPNAYYDDSILLDRWIVNDLQMMPKLSNSSGNSNENENVKNTFEYLTPTNNRVTSLPEAKIMAMESSTPLNQNHNYTAMMNSFHCYPPKNRTGIDLSANITTHSLSSNSSYPPFSSTEILATTTSSYMPLLNKCESSALHYREKGTTTTTNLSSFHILSTTIPTSNLLSYELPPENISCSGNGISPSIIYPVLTTKFQDNININTMTNPSRNSNNSGIFFMNNLQRRSSLILQNKLPMKNDTVQHYDIMSPNNIKQLSPNQLAHIPSTSNSTGNNFLPVPSNSLSTKSKPNEKKSLLNKRQSNNYQRKILKCKIFNCVNRARSRGLCKRHGGGKRCEEPNCDRAAQCRSKCPKHGGASRCNVEGCVKFSQSYGKCKAHGGGTQCSFEGCMKNAHQSKLCRTHGGGLRCRSNGCNKWAQKSGYCCVHTKELCQQSSSVIQYALQIIGEL